MAQVHGTGLEVDGLGVLLLGPSGSGKSDLALRLMDRGAGLIADDRTHMEVNKGRLEMSAPEGIKGLVEARGIGLMPVESRERAWLGLVIDLTAADQVERLPEPAAWEYLGITVPRLALAPFEASAVAKVHLAVRGVKDGIITAPGNTGIMDP